MHSLAFLQDFFVWNFVRTVMCFCFLLSPRVPLAVFSPVIPSPRHLWSCRDKSRRGHCKPTWISSVLVYFTQCPAGTASVNKENQTVSACSPLSKSVVVSVTAVTVTHRGMPRSQYMSLEWESYINVSSSTPQKQCKQWSWLKMWRELSKR